MITSAFPSTAPTIIETNIIPLMHKMLVSSISCCSNEVELKTVDVVLIASLLLLDVGVRVDRLPTNSSFNGIVDVVDVACSDISLNMIRCAFN